MSTPLVSVLVITYNHAAFVEEALDSLLAQTSTDLEVVIIDDVSPDGTADVIEAWLARTKFPAKLVRNRENQGICKNRNMGFEMTRGELICTLAGDDAYEPDRIAHQAEHFARHPASVAAVYSDACVVKADGELELPSFLHWSLGDAPRPEGRVFKRMLQGNFLCAPAVMLRRSALAAIGGYDESLAYEDWDMWLRLAHRFDFACLPEVLLRYRIVETSLSHDPLGRKKMRASDEHILAKWMNADLSSDERDAVLDALWRIAKMYLYMREDDAAARSFQKLAKNHPRPERRLAARLLQLPGAMDAARAVAATYRRARNMPEPI